MANNKIVEIKIIWCLWSDVCSCYVVSSNPEFRGFVVCEVLPSIFSILQRDGDTMNYNCILVSPS
jgi:hypothetical protein